MIAWIDLGGVVLFLLAISLYGLFRDKDPHSMNPRQFVPRDRERQWKSSRDNFIAFALAAVISVSQQDSQVGPDSLILFVTKFPPMGLMARVTLRRENIALAVLELLRPYEIAKTKCNR